MATTVSRSWTFDDLTNDISANHPEETRGVRNRLPARRVLCSEATFNIQTKV